MSKININHNNPMKRIVKLQFPCEIHQVDSKTIEIELPVMNEPTFTTAYCDSVIATLGLRMGERFLETEIESLMRKQVIAMIQ